MKKLTDTRVLTVLSNAQEDGSISTKTFFKLLLEFGLVRRYMEENYNGLLTEREAELVLDSDQFITHFPQTRNELDELDQWLESKD